MGLPPLIIALKKFNKDPDVYTVPKKNTYQHNYLMKLVHSEKKSKIDKSSYTTEPEYERIMRIIREAEEAVRQ